MRKLMPVITTALVPAIAFALTTVSPSASAAGVSAAALRCHASMTNTHPARRIPMMMASMTSRARKALRFMASQMVEATLFCPTRVAIRRQ